MRNTKKKRNNHRGRNQKRTRNNHKRRVVKGGEPHLVLNDETIDIMLNIFNNYGNDDNPVIIKYNEEKKKNGRYFQYYITTSTTHNK